MSITRDEVAHLARLSRLALAEEELDHFAGQLDVIIGAVARVERGRRRRDPADLARRAGDQRVPRRRDRPVPAPPTRRSARRRRPSTAGSGSRASWRRTDMSGELTDELTAAGAGRGAGRAARSRPSRSPRRTWTGSRAVDGRVHAFLHVAADRALAAARAVDEPARPRRAARPAGRRAARAQGRLHHHGHADHLRIEDPGGLAAAVRRDRHQRLREAGVDHPRQDQHGRVRDGLLHRELRVRPVPQPVGPRAGSPAAPPAARPPRSPRIEAPLAIGTDTGGSIRQPARGLRHRRGQADLRRLVPVRPGRVRVLAGHAGPAGPHRAGRRAAARGDLRARPVRLDLARRAGAAGRRRGPAGRRRRAARRRGHRARRRGLPAGRAGQRFTEAVELLESLGRQGRRGVLPALRATRCPPTT